MNRYDYKYNGDTIPGTYTFCLPGKKCTQCYINQWEQNNLMWTLDAQLAKSPWFQRSGGRDHVVVMSHWLHAQKWKKAPPHLKRCNAIVFEDKNVFRLNNHSHRGKIGQEKHPPPRHCQRQRANFTLAKGQPILLPSLYVNPHPPCPKNYTGLLTDFIFVGFFGKDDSFHFKGCMSRHLCAI